VLATFPDASVICGQLEQHGPSPKATALNPTVLVEVTSDSSEEYDTTDKVEYYRTISTLRDYVVVSHREAPDHRTQSLGIGLLDDARGDRWRYRRDLEPEHTSRRGRCVPQEHDPLADPGSTHSRDPRC